MARTAPETQRNILDYFSDGKAIPLGIKLFGIKTKLIDISDLLYFREILIKNSALIILSRRKNFVRQSISHLRMEILMEETKRKYGESHHSPITEGDIIGKHNIDLELFCHLIDHFDKLDKEIIEFVHSTGKSFETIFYEDIVHSPERIIARLSGLFDYDLIVHNYKVTLKHTPSDLSSVVLNYDELLDRIKGSPYEEMLQLP
ncbi:hypothetical protein N9H39_10885 [Gammaproteobacteria bacterium]|nr:hypothetical protein [Gammaproteobacteria bacterium]